jgi:hypothetical protein
MNKQHKDYQYFLDNRSKLIKKYPNKFLVIKNAAVIGVYDDQVTALTETSKEHELGTFIIQQASPESLETQVFHSRVLSI